MEVYPSKRKLDWKTWERLIKPAVRKHGKEAVLRGWTYMCRSKDTLWWRQHRKGTKLLSSFLKDDQKKTLTSMIAESEGWDETTEEVPKPAKKQEEESPELKKRLAEIDRKLRNPNWMDDPELKEMAKNLPER